MIIRTPKQKSTGQKWIEERKRDYKYVRDIGKKEEEYKTKDHDYLLDFIALHKEELPT